MTSGRWQRLKAIFEKVSEAPVEEREQMLLALCPDDAQLRAEALTLLHSMDSPTDFLEQPLHPTQPSLQPGEILCGRFELIRIAGQGGMGQVWAARDRRLDETVAIKTIHPLLARDPANLARFKKEIQLARRIAHPNVCRVHDMFEDPQHNGVVFLTMELIEGETLAAHLRRNKFAPAEALVILEQLLAGLSAAHSAGVIHRDLKPGNIMLASGATLRAVITDFGIARTLPVAGTSDSPTFTSNIVGTPEYMAPEQITGAPLSPATDLYALGLILYEMLAGKQPFPGRNSMDSWTRRLREAPPKLQGSVPGVNARVDAAITRSLSFDPAARFASAGEFWEAVNPTARHFDFGPVAKIPVAKIAAAVVIVLAVFFLWTRFRPVERPSAEAMRWYEDARQAIVDGAAVRASTLLEKALSLAPRFAAAHAALADAQLELDMAGASRDSILRATDLVGDPARLPRAEALYLEGTRRLILHDCTGAVDSFRQLSDAAPATERALSLLTLARALDRCEKADDAAQVLKQAFQLDTRHASALVRLASLSSRRRAFSDAFQFLDQAAAIYRARADFEGAAEVLQTRGAIQAEQDQLEPAAATLREAMTIAQTTRNPQQQIRIGLQQAIVHRKQGDMSSANDAAQAALTLARAQNLETLALLGLFSAGNIHLVRNQFPEAETQFQLARQIAGRNQHEAYHARAMLSLGSVFVRALQPNRAAEVVTAALPFYQRTGHTRNIAIAQTLMGQVRLARAEFPAAIRQFETELEQATRSKDSEQQLLARENLATALSSSGRFPEALTHYRAAASAYQTLGRKRSEAYALINVSETLSLLGLFAESTQILAQARRAVMALDQPADFRWRVTYLEGYGALRQGDYRTAQNAAHAILQAKSQSPPARILRAKLLLCAALSRAGRRQEGIPFCQQILATSQPSGLGSLTLDTQLLLAEAQLNPASAASADQLAASLSPALAASSMADSLWRASAIRAQSARLRGLDSATFAATANREIESLRSSWGDPYFQSWLKRADVRLYRAFVR